MRPMTPAQVFYTILSVCELAHAGACCTDEPTQWMKDNPSRWTSGSGKCADMNQWMKDNRCNKTQSWIDNNVCQQTCFDLGFGYPGDNCQCCPCTDEPTQLMKDNPSRWTRGSGKCADMNQWMKDNRCNKTQSWIDNNVCQQTCFDLGSGFPGDKCCTTTTTTTTTATTMTTVASIPLMPVNVDSPASGCPNPAEYTPFSSLLSVVALTAEVVVRTGQTCILDSSADVGAVRIESGAELIFADKEDLTLTVASINVLGKFQLGSPSCPLQSKGIVVTLKGGSDHGIYTEHPNHSKGIIAMAGGQLDVHGKPFVVTWSRIAKTALPGDTTLALQQPVDWEVGQQLVVITTNYEDDASNHQNEVKTIAGVNGNVITLDSALSFMHYGGPEYSCEVALLSRTITIQGDEFSERNQFGGHTMCMPGSTCRLSYVRGYRLGQLNTMGRYPFHFHLLGNVAKGAYFKGCTVQNSFFRAFTVHGTSSAEILRNVAFNITGSAYYLEDGVEEDNRFEFNLAAHIHLISPLTDYGAAQASVQILTTIPERIVPTDATAAGFYCTNANNRWIGNVASGGFVGFLFPAVPNALALSYAGNAAYCPQCAHMLEFDGNTAHSSGRHWGNGGCIYVGGKLTQPDKSNTSHYEYDYGRTGVWPSLGVRRFKNVKTFACRKGFAYWGGSWDAPLELESFEAHDSWRAV